MGLPQIYARDRGNLTAVQVREGMLPRVGQYREQAFREPRVLLAVRSLDIGFNAIGSFWEYCRR